MSSSFISSLLFHHIEKDVLCFSHEISEFKTIIEPDRQSRLEGLKSRHCVPQTRTGRFVDLALI